MGSILSLEFSFVINYINFITLDNRRFNKVNECRCNITLSEFYIYR